MAIIRDGQRPSLSLLWSSGAVLTDGAACGPSSHRYCFEDAAGLHLRMSQRGVRGRCAPQATRTVWLRWQSSSRNLRTFYARFTAALLARSDCAPQVMLPGEQKAWHGAGTSQMLATI